MEKKGESGWKIFIGGMIIGALVVFGASYTYYHRLLQKQSLVLNASLAAQRNLSNSLEAPFEYSPSLSTTATDKSASSTPTPVATTKNQVSVPILNYHYIRAVANPKADSLGISLSIDPILFDQQINWLVNRKYNFITPDDLYSSLTFAVKLPPNPVLLTFDDGYADFYSAAFPVLKKYNAKATAYIIVDKLDDKEGRYLTTRQLIELDQSGLITIGSHTVHHSNLANPKVNLVLEIVDSKMILEKILGHVIDTFAYPSGLFNNAAVVEVGKAGYKTAVTTAQGLWHTDTSLLTLSRVRVNGNYTTLTNFENEILGRKITSGSTRTSTSK